MGTFLSDIVLQILSFVAENERNLIKIRQAKGIAIAKDKGVRFGRPIKQVPDNFHEMCEKWKLKEITCTEAAKNVTCLFQHFHIRRKDTLMKMIKNSKNMFFL